MTDETQEFSQPIHTAMTFLLPPGAHYVVLTFIPDPTAEFLQRMVTNLSYEGVKLALMTSAMEIFMGDNVQTHYYEEEQ